MAVGGIGGLLGIGSPFGAPIRQARPTADQAVNNMVAEMPPPPPPSPVAPSQGITPRGGVEGPAQGTRITDPQTGREFTVGGAMTQDFQTGLAYRRAMEAYDPNAPTTPSAPAPTVTTGSLSDFFGPSSVNQSAQQAAMATAEEFAGPAQISPNMLAQLQQFQARNSAAPTQQSPMQFPSPIPPPSNMGPMGGGQRGLMQAIPQAIAPVLLNAHRALDSGIGDLITQAFVGGNRGGGGPANIPMSPQTQPQAPMQMTTQPFNPQAAQNSTQNLSALGGLGGLPGLPGLFS